MVDGNLYGILLTVPSAEDDGAQLEEGRLQLIELLEDPTFTAATRVTRENIAYLYAFEFPNP